MPSDSGDDRGRGRGGDDFDWLYRTDGAADRTQALDQTQALNQTQYEQTRAYDAADEAASRQELGAPTRRRASFGDASGDGGTPVAQPSRPAQPPPAQPPPPSARKPVPPAARPPTARPGRTGRRRPPIGKIIAGVLIAWLVFLIATPAYAWTQATKVEAMPTGDRPAGQPGTLWLLIGSDGRDDLDEAERERLSTGTTSGQRTDTIMLLYRPQTGQPALISVPRDSFVDIPGRGKNKINAAYAFGGAPLLIQTIEENTGLRVDHYGEIGFSGFAGLVDAVGGIEICPEKAIKDPRAGLDIKGGCQQVDGPTALGYVRTRYEDPTGDIGRTKRQREVIGKIARKVASPATIINPFRYWGVNMAAARSLGVDEGASPVDVGTMGMTMLGTAGADGLTLIVPISNPNARTSAGSSVLWDDERATELFDQIASGNTEGMEKFKPGN